MRDDAEIFVPHGVCSKLIRYVVEDETLVMVRFTGGCDGNLKAISALVEGMDIREIVARLSGIRCGGKSTSCADQFCHALQEYLDAKA